jgi:cholinesterase
MTILIHIRSLSGYCRRFLGNFFFGRAAAGVCLISRSSSCRSICSLQSLVYNMSFLLSSLLALHSFGALVAAEPAAEISTAKTAWTVGQRVQAGGAVIHGQASKWQPEVSEYLGVPFAKPPVGDLRFAAPKPIQLNGTIFAHKFGFSCPTNLAPPKSKTVSYESWAQTLLDQMSQADEDFSEDCLTLNVWSKPQTGEKAKAVLVW